MLINMNKIKRIKQFFKEQRRELNLFFMRISNDNTIIECINAGLTHKQNIVPCMPDLCESVWIDEKQRIYMCLSSYFPFTNEAGFDFHVSFKYQKEDEMTESNKTEDVFGDCKLVILDVTK